MTARGWCRPALAIATLILAMFVARRLWQFAAAPGVMDFTLFWNAGRLALEGRAVAAYVPHWSPLGEVAALAYPPAYLLLVAPLGLAGVVVALAAWLAVGALLYLAAARRWRLLALAHPPAAYNALVGQNGFLSGAAILFGAAMADRRPWASGALLGLVSLKPQLTPAIAIALVAGRHWRTLLAALVTAAALNIAAALAFGTEPFRRFATVLAGQREMLTSGQWDWTLLASSYGFVRWFGIGDGPALLVHGVIAAAATVALWLAWRHRWETKVAALAATTMLLSPYLFTYDAVVLVAAIAAVAAVRPAAAAAAWALTLPPFVMAVGPYSGPNTVPLAAILCLAVLCRAPTGHVRAAALDP